MSKLLFCLSLLSFVTLPANAVRDGVKIQRTSDNFPNIVRITYGKSTCSGTRVTFDTVLTAAHCFGEDIRKSSFEVEYLNGDVVISEKLRVSNVKIKSRDLDQELAVFKINPRFGNDELYSPSIIYDYQEGEFPKGEKFIFAGYGMDNSEDTKQLRRGNLKLLGTKVSTSNFKELDEKAMKVRNDAYLKKLAKETVVDKAAELPELELADCENSGLGWRGRRICRKNNNYLIYQRDLELRAIAYEEEERERKIKEYLETPIFKTTLVKGYEMIVLEPLEQDDELAEGEYPNQLPCPGDSGGPLYKRLPSGDIALVGIISNIKASPRVFAQVGQLPGHEICEKAFAANYIPVALHFNFLKENNITF